MKLGARAAVYLNILSYFQVSAPAESASQFAWLWVLEMGQAASGRSPLNNW